MRCSLSGLVLFSLLAASQLQEGQMVRVNGETGSVEILDGS